MQEPSYRYKATVVRVVDGDTMDLDVDLGFRVHARIRVRLAGIDTPEIHGVKHDSEEYQEGMKAKAFVESWVSSYGPDLIVVTSKGTGKYGRWIANVFDPNETNHSLNLALVAEGLAKTYEG
jgi:micrococcal nuclease